jgi:hypothetical protein
MRCLTIVAFLLASVVPAHAYIDGGSGSFFFQSAIAGILALAFASKLFFRRVVKFLATRFGRK